MKKLILAMVLVFLMTTQVEAVIPQGFSLFTWFNQIVGDLSLMNMKLEQYYEDWAILPQAVRNGVKARVVAKIDEAIQRLVELKGDINAL